MASCKECLYYEVCPLGLVVKGKTGTCLKFKNKADFVEVKHGHWIKVGKTEGRSNILKCSVCGRVRRGISKTAYCKDCGARMDGERSDT